MAESGEGSRRVALRHGRPTETSAYSRPGERASARRPMFQEIEQSSRVRAEFGQVLGKLSGSIPVTTVEDTREARGTCMNQSLSILAKPRVPTTRA